MGGVSLTKRSFQPNTGVEIEKPSKCKLRLLECTAEHYARLEVSPNKQIKGTSKYYQLASKGRKPLEGIPKATCTYFNMVTHSSSFVWSRNA